MTDWADDAVTGHKGTEAEPVEELGETQQTLYYGSVDEFVREYLRHVYRRRMGLLHG